MPKATLAIAISKVEVWLPIFWRRCALYAWLPSRGIRLLKIALAIAIKWVSVWLAILRKPCAFIVWLPSKGIRMLKIALAIAIKWVSSVGQHFKAAASPPTRPASCSGGSSNPGTPCGCAHGIHMEFIGAATFEALSGQPVHTGIFADVPAVPHRLSARRRPGGARPRPAACWRAPRTAGPTTS